MCVDHSVREVQLYALVTKSTISLLINYMNTLVGRIINRFAKDTGAVDETLLVAMKGSLERIFYTIGILLQILIINWWTIFPMILMLYIFLKINNIYISTVQDIKRLEGNGKKLFNQYLMLV